MKKEVWGIDMPFDEFRKAISQLVAAENAGITVGRINFDTPTKIISIGVPGTAPIVKDGKLEYPS